MSPIDKASRKLTQILRHKIVDYNLIMNEEGYVKITDIYSLNLKEFKNINNNDINQIVETNEKKRFELKIINEELFIRATQGHNTNVGLFINDSKSLTKITLSDVSDTTDVSNVSDVSTNTNYNIYHGTKKEYLNSIIKTGLNKMNRKHIHFVENINRDKQMSGFKNSSDIILKINMKLCIEDGIVFYKSSNNVILTEGINGLISSKYIIEIIENIENIE
jgi:2'-phosphotransferase